MKGYLKCCISIAVIATIVLPAWSQQYVSSRGHLLDANMRVGGSSQNRRNIMSFNYKPDSNLFITGNVTGGARFQGTVPYRSQQEFQGNLGFRPLDNFRRDSVGLESLSNSFMNSPMPFVDTNRSITTRNGNAIVNTGTVNLTRPESSGRFANLRGYNTDRRFQFNTYNTQLNTNMLSVNALEPDVDFNPTQPGKTVNLRGPVYNRDIAYTVNSDQIPNRLNTYISLQPDSDESSMMYGDLYQSKQNSQESSVPSVLLPGEMKVTLPGRIGEDATLPVTQITRQPQVQLAYRSTHLDNNLSTGKTANNLQPEISNIPRITMKLDYQKAAETKALNYVDQANTFYQNAAYEDAAAKLKLAAIYAPQDPGIILAYSHALLAHGDLLTGGFELDRSLRIMDKNVARAQFTAKTFRLTGAELLTERLSALNEKLSTEFEPIYGLTKAYLLYLTNRPSEAITLLQSPDMQKANLKSAKILLQVLQNQ